MMLNLLIQFAYVLYLSYKTLVTLQNIKLTLWKYTILIVILSVIRSASGDVLISRAAYMTTHRDMFFHPIPLTLELHLSPYC